jgi:hypothetical protein
MKILIAATDRNNGITKVWAGESSGKPVSEAIKEMLQSPPDMELDHNDLCEADIDDPF